MNLLRSSLVFAALVLAPLHAEIVTIGKYQAKILPEQVTHLMFQTRGSVTDIIRTDCKRLEKDTIIGILDKDKTEEAREDMELQLARERMNKQDDIRKLELQRAQLGFYLKLPEGERIYAQDVKGSFDTEITPDALKDIDARIDLLRREMSTLERRKRSEFEAKYEKNTLRMPFAGRLQYNVPLPENPDEPLDYTQSVTGQPFATVCDDSAFYIVISISSTDLILLPEERFSVYIDLPAGRRLSGTYAFHRVEKGAGTDILAYFFKIDPSEHDTAFNMLGSSAMANLVYSAEEGIVRVPKVELLAHPSAPDCEDWKQLVSLAYPGYVVVVATERDILIRKKTPSESDS